MIYLNLLLTFFKIGLFSFGGGYAMIPLIEKEIAAHGWMTAQEFANIIAVAEMTPGPIAVNSATFVGYKSAGLVGGLVATTGVALPSMMLILLLSHFFFKYQQHSIMKGVFYGIRPVIVGLIIGAAFFVAETTLVKGDILASTFTNVIRHPGQYVDFLNIGIMTISLIALIRYKLNPILMIFLSGAAGVLIYFIVR